LRILKKPEHSTIMYHISYVRFRPQSILTLRSHSESSNDVYRAVDLFLGNFTGGTYGLGSSTDANTLASTFNVISLELSMSIKCPFCARQFSKQGSNNHQRACRLKYEMRRAARRRNQQNLASFDRPNIKRRRIDVTNEGAGSCECIYYCSLAIS
jgi:hypothetical protein